MDISLDVAVHCMDGFGGHSTHVTVNPITQIVSHIVVAETKAPHLKRLVPISWVNMTTLDLIVLNCNRDQLAQMERFVMTEFIRLETTDRYSVGYPYLPPALEYKPQKTVCIEVENIPIEAVAVRQGARIEACDGPIGVLEAVQIDPTDGRITHVRLRIGPIWEYREVTVSAAEIQRIEERTIHLKLTKAAVTDLAAVTV
jgi:hypothetical protein